MDIGAVYDALFERWSKRIDHCILEVEADDEWRSPCEVKADDGTVTWRPVLRDRPAELGVLEQCYGAPLPADVRALLGTRYFGPIQCTIDHENEQLPVILLSIWNDEDLERLLRSECVNIEETRLDSNPRIYIGNTADDRFYSLSLIDGRVRLEDFGREPHVLAESLVEFLEGLVR